MSEKENAQGIADENLAGMEPDEGVGQGQEEGVMALLEDARNKADEHWNQLLRTQAEMENLKKRSQRDIENAHKFALEKFFQELLPVRDSMELGINAAQGENVDPATLQEGMDLTLKMFVAVMDKFGIEEINPVDEKFNPDLHQAMSMQEVEGKEPNTVLAVVQRGYQLNGRLIRPAMVIVARAPAREAAQE